MRYSVKQYAAALLAALKDKSGAERKTIIRNFLILLRKNKDWPRLGLIVKEEEKQYFKGLGLRRVRVESPVSIRGIKREIEDILGSKIFVEELERPELLAGVNILIDDELLIDASAKRQMERLFTKE